MQIASGVFGKVQVFRRFIDEILISEFTQKKLEICHISMDDANLSNSAIYCSN
jgi:hypothetical protein